MNWFKGEIAQAVSTSKAKGAIFVVYVFGNDEKSTQISELMDKEEIAKVLGGEKFVAIQVEADSVSYQQFSQIYKQVPIPSIYFIGKQGVPIEIVTEANDIQTFQEKLQSVLQKGGLTPVATQSQDLINSEQSQSQPTEPSKPPNVVCENGVCTIVRDDKPTPSSPDSATTSTSQQSEVGQVIEEKKEVPIEDKVERAKELIEKKREEKRKEEIEKERQQEIERRKMGQNVQQLKRWQDDQELKQVLEEREKEKRESQAARNRVLAQIAQDKAERAAKFSNSPPQQPQTSQQSPQKPGNSNVARLQFRMPDGRAVTQDFASSDTLEAVHAHIRANLNLPFSSYTLSTTFPRREFGEGENGQSLLDLGLVPTAVILILPLNRGAVSTNPSGGLTGLFWSLLSPIFTILGYLKTFVFGSGPAPSADGQNKRAADNEPNRGQPKVRRGGESTVIRRQGNVHRLSNRNDSDDENNTWNGNSTQQM